MAPKKHAQTKIWKHFGELIANFGTSTINAIPKP
jgi:hypothetical protein